MRSQIKPRVFPTPRSPGTILERPTTSSYSLIAQTLGVGAAKHAEVVHAADRIPEKGVQRHVPLRGCPPDNATGFVDGLGQSQWPPKGAYVIPPLPHQCRIERTVSYMTKRSRSAIGTPGPTRR